jgi:hypothetical protein
MLLRMLGRTIEQRCDLSQERDPGLSIRYIKIFVMEGTAGGDTYLRQYCTKDPSVDVLHIGQVQGRRRDVQSETEQTDPEPLLKAGLNAWKIVHRQRS